MSASRHTPPCRPTPNGRVSRRARTEGDRQGRLVGLVTANPSDKQLVAGIAPQRSYALADSAAIQGVLGNAGLSLTTDSGAAASPESRGPSASGDTP